MVSPVERAEAERQLLVAEHLRRIDREVTARVHRRTERIERDDRRASIAAARARATDQHADRDRGGEKSVTDIYASETERSWPHALVTPTPARRSNGRKGPPTKRGASETSRVDLFGACTSKQRRWLPVRRASASRACALPGWRVARRLHVGDRDGVRVCGEHLRAASTHRGPGVGACCRRGSPASRARRRRTPRPARSPAAGRPRRASRAGADAWVGAHERPATRRARRGRRTAAATSGAGCFSRPPRRERRFMLVAVAWAFARRSWRRRSRCLRRLRSRTRPASLASLDRGSRICRAAPWPARGSSTPATAPRRCAARFLGVGVVEDLGRRPPDRAS